MNDAQEKTLDMEKRKLLLSNERTFLSYVRTSTSVLVLAVALLKFFESKTVLTLGYVCLGIGFLILVLGGYRYFAEKSQINSQ